MTTQPSASSPPSWRDAGFTLIEVLVVTAIVGILAGISIPQFVRFSARGTDALMVSDLRNAALSMEEDYAVRGFYDAAGLAGFQGTDGVALATSISVGGTTYCLTASVAGQPARVYDHANGGLLDVGAICP